jgi:hypothetical protein
MASGLSWVWWVTCLPWAAVIVLDLMREPRDWRRWLISLSAFAAIAYLGRGGLGEVNLRFALIAGLGLVVLLAMIAGEMKRRRRARRMAKWTAEHGYRPIAIARGRTQVALPEGLHRLPIFNLGMLPRTDEMIARPESASADILVFRHSIRRKVAWYDVGGVEASGTVIALRRPGLWLPFFQVRPRAMYPWMDGGPVGEDVPLGHASTFARTYRLGGHEPKNLRAFFGDDLLAAIAEKPGWVIQGEGEWLAAFYYDRSTNLMSLKPSALRSSPLERLDDHVRDAELLLDKLADRGARFASRDLGAA